ncbi:MAG: hypothetical protein KDN19_00375 [Verrucomicrobiae bacterium]|nr:hypothetical protein [Verrucomicrobiae bacterium]
MLLGIGAFLLSIPTFLALAVRDAEGRHDPGAGICMGLFLGPMGLMMIFMGIAYLRLRIGFDDEAKVLRLQLPRSGSTPWFPWMVPRTEMPYDSIARIEAMSRANYLAPNKVETLYFLRSESNAGDRLINSVWFRDSEKILERLLTISSAEVSERSLDEPFAPGEKRLLSEKLMHAAGYGLIGISVILVLLLLIVAINGDSEARWDAFRGMSILLITLPGAAFMFRYRKPR